jgi:hypothetical protein
LGIALQQMAGADVMLLLRSIEMVTIGGCRFNLVSFQPKSPLLGS